VTLAVGH